VKSSLVDMVEPSFADILEAVSLEDIGRLMRDFVRFCRTSGAWKQKREIAAQAPKIFKLSQFLPGFSHF